MLLLTSGEAWALGPLAMALLGGPWVAEGDIACGVGGSQGTKGFLESEQYFWMTGHSGEFMGLFCCLKKEQQRSRAEGERISID